MCKWTCSIQICTWNINQMLNLNSHVCPGSTKCKLYHLLVTVGSGVQHIQSAGCMTLAAQLVRLNDIPDHGVNMLTRSAADEVLLRPLRLHVFRRHRSSGAGPSCQGALEAWTAQTARRCLPLVSELPQEQATSFDHNFLPSSDPLLLLMLSSVPTQWRYVNLAHMHKLLLKVVCCNGLASAGQHSVAP